MAATARRPRHMMKVNRLNDIVGQKRSIKLLKTLLRDGTLPHALLFSGNAGVGKRSTALALAMACNCRSLHAAPRQGVQLEEIEACGTCDACRKIGASTHPDIIHVAPQASVIRIGQIRDLLQTLRLKPYEAARRVVVIAEAQTMNSESGNALLKVLEEPPEGTLLILTACQPSDLLPTVVSRCRPIRFAPLAAEDITALLTGVDGIDPETAKTVAALCDGSVSRARRLVDEKWLSYRDWIITTVSRRITQTGDTDLRAWLAFSEKLARGGASIDGALEIITMWLRDVLVAKHDPRHVWNRDHMDGIAAAAGVIDASRLIEQIDAVDRAQAALGSNTNARLTLDAMVLKMAGAGT